MQLTSIIDVALGLILLYLVLSLVCTTINEFVAALLKLRARNLADTLAQLIDSPEFLKTFYSHGLIVSSALSSRGGAVQWASGADDAEAADGTTATPLRSPLPSYLDGQTFARAIVDSLDPSKPLKAVEDIRTSIEKLPANSVIRAALLANLAIADQSVDAFRSSVANWFDSAMDRLAGNYNRQLKGLSLAVGLVLAAALNADSLSIARAIWTDDSLKTQVAEASQRFVGGQNADLMTACASASTEPGDELKCAADKLSGLEHELRPFPLGWPDSAEPPQGTDGWRYWFLAKLLGVFWTGVALSLGAPFWFDLLQRVMSLRAAGGKPASTTDPQPEPAKTLQLNVPDDGGKLQPDWTARTKNG